VIRERERIITVRTTAISGLRHLQLAAGLVLIFSAATLFGFETADNAQNSEVLDNLAETSSEEEAPRFVVPPDPKLPYLDAIDRLEEDYGPYAIELSDLYLGLGEVFLNEGEYEEARDAYHRGVMVVRVNSGPNSTEQTNLLYLIANIETLLDEPKQADKILENIRFINEQFYGEGSPELYPVYERIYGWYQTTRPLDVEESKYKDYLKVIDIAEAMVEIHAITNGLALSEAATSYRRLAESHFEAMRFAMAEDEWVDPRIIVSSDVPYRVTPGYEDLSMREHYIEGRDAFRTYLELLQADESKTPLDYAEALADFGDWSLHFEKFRAARKLYEQAYQVLADSTEYAELVDEYLGQPRPMEFTDIHSALMGGPPLDEGSMSIDISMTVTRIGDVRYVEILNPPESVSAAQLTEIRRTVQKTPFRPSLKDGKAVTTEGFIWQHVIHIDPAEESGAEERTS
jgi:tetratricopeptide (TPR) repeat protein